MNPLDFWYKTKPDIKKFIALYFQENIDWVSNYQHLKTDCENLYHNGNVN